MEDVTSHLPVPTLKEITFSDKKERKNYISMPQHTDSKAKKTPTPHGHQDVGQRE